MGGFRSALDHWWVASDQRGWLQLGVGRVWLWGVGGRRCSWLAMGRVRSSWVAGHGSDRPLLHLARTSSSCRLHKQNLEITGLSSTFVATRSTLSSPSVVTNNDGIDWFSGFYFFGFPGFIFLAFILWVNWVGLIVMVVGMCCFSHS